jgi:hypothetical protein
VSTELEFGAWADVVEVAARPQYGAAVARSAVALNIRFPRLDERYVRLRIRRTKGGEDLGWIVVTNTQMRQNQYFGDLHVGALVDGYGRLEHLPTLIAAGLRELWRRDVDLVVANWSHAAWVTACRKAAFLVGPSNYFFFAPSATPLLSPEGYPLERMHLTRGDGDGPGLLLPRRPKS